MLYLTCSRHLPRAVMPHLYFVAAELRRRAPGLPSACAEITKFILHIIEIRFFEKAAASFPQLSQRKSVSYNAFYLTSLGCIMFSCPWLGSTVWGIFNVA